jgi:hypothetical protein
MTFPPTKQEKEQVPAKAYIGDGVYVSYEWGDLRLETERSNGTHWIVLEPQVYAALVAYVAAQRKKAEGR